MTSAGGAGAMAGPRAGAEAERRRRAATRLQACARGFLLRRRLRGLREEFEAAVLEIEGEPGQLRWGGRALQSPRFGTALSPGKDPGGAAQSETIPKNPPEEPDPPGAGRAGSFGNTPKPPKTPKPPNLGSGAAESPENEGKAQECDSDSAASGCDSPEIPAELRELPRSELQSQKIHLLMELLWVQQAIASRKHFLMLKQQLGIPECSRGIPECSRRIPECSRRIPECSRGIPECSRGIPECSRGVPECSRGVPECSRGIPECSRGIPECSRRIPECSRGLPECSRGIPECSRRIPECSRGIPECSRRIPECSRSIPEVLDWFGESLELQQQP